MPFSYKKVLISLFLVITTSNMIDCDYDEAIVYHKNLQEMQTVKDLSVIEKPKVVESITSPKIEKDSSIVEVKIKRNKRLKIQLIKECEPKCDKLETCNTEKGHCEGIAKSFKWDAEKEHSETFFVNTSKMGTYDSRSSDYLMRNR